MEILFVCTGNICRSPFAALRMQALAQARGRQDITCRSAGIAVEPGDRCPPVAVRAASAFGVQLEAHRAKNLEPAELSAADVILIMEDEQLGGIWDRVRVPLEAPIWNLAAFSPGPHRPARVPDPYRAEPWATDVCYHFIEACLGGLLTHLMSRSVGGAAGLPRP